ncbi:hypothetical protein T484DRAFT_1810220 [Baffinella frigidus]|nr:hypothetical protein T484DRAFT_1810220 [Cryptophyta sp. CCMP2293]
MLGAMRVQGSSEEVQAQGCVALGFLASNIENRVAIAAKGGIEAVVGVMVAHSSSEGVHLLALELLVESGERWGDAVKAAGVPQGSKDVGLIISRMGLYGSSAAVQGAGFVSLRDLIREDHTNTVAIAAKGGIEAVVKGRWPHTRRARRKHGLSTEQVPVPAYVGSSKNLTDLKEVQQEGCVLIGRLATNAEKQVAMALAAKGGIHRPTA